MLPLVRYCATRQRTFANLRDPFHEMLLNSYFEFVQTHQGLVCPDKPSALQHGGTEVVQRAPVRRFVELPDRPALEYGGGVRPCVHRPAQTSIFIAVFCRNKTKRKRRAGRRVVYSACFTNTVKFDEAPGCQGSYWRAGEVRGGSKGGSKCLSSESREDSNECCTTIFIEQKQIFTARRAVVQVLVSGTKWSAKLDLE